MIIPIEVQFSGLEETDFSEKLLKNLQEKVLNSLTDQFATQLQTQAEITLRSSKQRYIDAISVNKNEDQYSVNLNTDDFVVHMVEEGNESFDMKKGFLKSPNVKVSKNGQKYITIPLPKHNYDGKYNWRDRKTGRFSKGTNEGPVEFRRVSENSKPNSWIHPGHPGHNLVGKTLEQFNAQELTDRIVQEELDKL